MSNKKRNIIIIICIVIVIGIVVCITYNIYRPKTKICTREIEIKDNKYTIIKKEEQRLKYNHDGKMISSQLYTTWVFPTSQVYEAWKDYFKTSNSKIKYMNKQNKVLEIGEKLTLENSEELKNYATIDEASTLLKDILGYTCK